MFVRYQSILVTSLGVFAIASFFISILFDYIIMALAVEILMEIFFFTLCVSIENSMFLTGMKKVYLFLQLASHR